MLDLGTPQVKALTFKTLRTFLPEYLGPQRAQILVGRLSPQTAALLNEPESYEWVAEKHLHELMLRIYEDAFRGNDEAFLDFARALAVSGINRFLRVFLSLASERFVLRKIPVVWDRLRRNAGSVVAVVGDDTVRLEYGGFRLFGERVYRLLSLANCQALVLAATQRIPKGTIVSWSEDTLVLEFSLNESHEPSSDA